MQRRHILATLIYPTGKITAVTRDNGTAFTATEIHALVDASLVCVCLRDGRIMWIDDEGKLKGKQPNMGATFLALDVLQSGDVIVGNAVITTLAEAGEEA